MVDLYALVVQGLFFDEDDIYVVNGFYLYQSNDGETWTRVLPKDESADTVSTRNHFLLILQVCRCR